MFDDTRELLPNESRDQIENATRYNIRENVATIINQRMTRVHTSSWADSLRFLTFDDGQDHEPQETNQDTPLLGRCQPCQERLPLPAGHVCEKHLSLTPTARIENREAELHQYANPCVHVREHSCETCQHIPLFPNEGKITKFRIRRVNKVGSNGHSRCDHFVAVSYCWSAATANRSDDEEGPYKVVEEDGSVRDMRAAKSTINRVVTFARENGFRMIWIDQECIEQDNPEQQELAIQAMDNVYLRAQTSIGLFNAELSKEDIHCFQVVYETQLKGAGNSRRGQAPPPQRRLPTRNEMYGALSKVANDRWNTRAWILQEAFASSGNMFLLFPRLEGIDVSRWMLVCHEWSRSELAIRLDAMQTCFQVCTPFIRPVVVELRTRARLGAFMGQRPPAPGANQQERQDEKTDPELTLKRIECFHPGEPGKATTIFAGTNKPRRTCNAAVALTFLKLRGLLRVPDKLAILANMCGYHVRFNTIELEKTQDSLGACVIALSVINNDFSLLVPEFYRVPSNIPLVAPSHDDGEFSWVHSLSRKIPLLQVSEWNPFGAFSLENVGSTVDLSYNGLSILGHLWKKDRFISLESLQIKHARSWEQLRTGKGHSKPDGETVRLATTHIMFKIIETLVSKGEKELADSILNSTSNRYWNSRSDLDDMIESVDEFPPGLQVENRAGMFALDPALDGRYHQSWIIDRVMEQGGLWSWALVNNTPKSDLTAEASEQEADKELEKHFANHNHSRMLIIASMLSRMGEEATREVMSTNPGMKNSLMKHSAAGSIMALYMTKVGTQGPEMGRRRATFDVDVSVGETFVLTPFQMVLESLPRPTIRGMSVSWVVEEMDSRFDVLNPAHEEKERFFKVKGMARGMWRFILLSTGRYTLV